jgi:hypothetical protein
MSDLMTPALAAEETARQIEASLQRTTEPMKAEVLIQLAASWRVYAHMLTHACTCGYGGPENHNPYNAHCDLVPHADPFRGGY